jgi:hypothetical protein
MPNQAPVIITNEEVKKFITETQNMVSDIGSTETYYIVSDIFKVNIDTGVMEMIQMEMLPEDLIDRIKNINKQYGN